MFNRKALYISRKILYRQAVLVVPIISFFVVAMLVLFEAHKYRQVGREVDYTNKQINQLGILIKEMDARPPLTVIPVILQSPVEQPDFIDVLRSRAEGTHVTLSKWANAAAPANNGGTPAPASEANPGATRSLPQEVSTINCTIEVTGQYNDLRHFLYSLQDAPRLFTLSDMVWSRNNKWPETTLKFNLARYVTLSGSAPMRMPEPSKATIDSAKSNEGSLQSARWSYGPGANPNSLPSTDSHANVVSTVSDSRGTQ